MWMLELSMSACAMLRLAPIPQGEMVTGRLTLVVAGRRPHSGDVDRWRIGRGGLLTTLVDFAYVTREPLWSQGYTGIELVAR